MARTRMSTRYNFAIVNLRTLETEILRSLNITTSSAAENDDLLEKVEHVDSRTLNRIIKNNVHPHVIFSQQFYAMKGFGYSEFDEYLNLFKLNNGEEITMLQLYGLDEREESIPNFETETCFDDYKVVSVGRFEYVPSDYQLIHPIYLFRFVELCEFDKCVNSKILLQVLGEHYQSYLSDNTTDDDIDENADELLSPPTKKIKVDNNEKLTQLIWDETCNIDWDDDLLGAYRKMLHMIDPVVVDKDESDMSSTTTTENSSSFHNNPPTTLPNLRLLGEVTDMLYCIIEFIGNVKTLFNFSISCRGYYEIFQKANQNNLLLKRIAKDIGLIMVVHC